MAQLLLLNSQPNQILQVTVAINGGTVTLGIRQYYNRVGDFWLLDIFAQDGSPLIYSLPLITGDWPAGNIMAPYDYLEIGQWFVINQNGAATDFPNSSNLGSGFTVLVDSNVGSGIAPGFPAVPSVAGSGEWSSYNVAGLTTVLG